MAFNDIIESERIVSSNEHLNQVFLLRNPYTFYREEATDSLSLGILVSVTRTRTLDFIGLKMKGN